MTPFGNGRFLVGVQIDGKVGYKIVTTSGESAVQFPLALSRQTLATVASGTDGCLALWEEDGEKRNVLGVRFLHDGTRLDATPFIVVTNGVFGPIRALYETNAYHVVWSGSVQGQLVDPTGPPNVRPAPPVLIRNYPDLELTRFGGELVAYQRVASGTSISTASQSKTEEGFVSLAGAEDGVFHADVVRGAIWTGITPGPFDMLVRTQWLGTSPRFPAAVASLGTNFFVGWQDSVNDIIGAITSGGARAKTNVVFKNLRASVSLTAAARQDAAILSVTMTNNPTLTPITNFLAVYDQASGTYSVASQLLPIVTNSVSVAPFGKDFVMAMTTRGETGPVAALQFITMTAAATATIAVDVGGGLTIKFENLETARRYRIERSTDLVNWEFLQSVSKTESLTLPVDAALAAAFYRAVLEPE